MIEIFLLSLSGVSFEQVSFIEPSLNQDRHCATGPSRTTIASRYIRKYWLKNCNVLRRLPKKWWNVFGQRTPNTLLIFSITRRRFVFHFLKTLKLSSTLCVYRCWATFQWSCSVLEWTWNANFLSYQPIQGNWLRPGDFIPFRSLLVSCKTKARWSRKVNLF